MSKFTIEKKNFEQISQVAYILNGPLDDDTWKQIVSAQEMRINLKYNIGANELKKLNLDKNIYCDIDFEYSNDKIEIPEKCYLYDYIAEHNIFKKYENKLINLFRIIFTSDLFRDLIKLIYKADDENMKYFFEEEMTVEEFWNNCIIFVPFKIDRVSGFSYKDTFSIFFSFYKFQYFRSNIENEIFTLGAFVRVMIHEIFGQIMLAYFYFMFYANFQNNKDNFYFPRIQGKIKKLNKSCLYEKIGVTLAKIFCDNLLEVEEKNKLLEKLCKNFETILGKEYAKRLTQKLLEDKDIGIIKIKKADNLTNLSVKIVDILMEFISIDFDNYIKDLVIKQNKYKEEESGNLVEFLLFNNFNQYITLKECLFLLDEEVYQNTNIFKFRFKFNNVPIINNDEFIKELAEGKKIFNDIFSEYKSIYEENKDNNNDLIFPKNFRENCEENLNKKIEPFQCINFSLDRRIFQNEKKSNS